MSDFWILQRGDDWFVMQRSGDLTVAVYWGHSLQEAREALRDIRGDE